jgi:hypothetical protein
LLLSFLKVLHLKPLFAVYFSSTMKVSSIVLSHLSLSLAVIGRVTEAAMPTIAPSKFVNDDSLHIHPTNASANTVLSYFAPRNDFCRSECLGGNHPVGSSAAPPLFPNPCPVACHDSYHVSNNRTITIVCWIAQIQTNLSLAIFYINNLNLPAFFPLY